MPFSGNAVQPASHFRLRRNDYGSARFMLLSRQRVLGGPLPQTASELVTVVTPVFNGEHDLADAIDSCLAQTHGNFELLIVDDGSTDASGAIADSYAARDPRVRVFHTPNQGISGARNTALRHARGSLIALLDSDDTWMPSYLEAQVRTLATNPWADVATANTINLGGDLNGTPYWPPSNELRPISMLDMITKEDSVQIMSVFRRSVVDRIGGFNEKLGSNEDYQFWLRAAAAGSRFIADYTPRAYYRRRTNSVSADEPRMLAGIIKVLRELAPQCPIGSPERSALDAQVSRFSRRLLVSEARGCVVRGEPARAAAYLQQIPRQDRDRVLSLILAVATVWPAALGYGYRLRRAMRNRRHRGNRRRATSVTPRWPDDLRLGNERRAADR
jgi:glycosyltransferase involved in cell wall biosynthesis